MAGLGLSVLALDSSLFGGLSILEFRGLGFKVWGTISNCIALHSLFGFSTTALINVQKPKGVLCNVAGVT